MPILREWCLCTTGASSNVFILQNGTVFTAEEGVLKGTVRQVVLDVCATNNIPVEFSPLPASGYSEWDGMLLTSTSRLALAVDRMWVEEAGAQKEVLFNNEDKGSNECSLAKRIVSLVQDSLLNGEEPVLSGAFREVKL